jgi:4-hydroxymandelate oxidase
MFAPTGVQSLAHPEGECAAARGAGEAGTLMAVSTVSSANEGPLWFQLYIYEGARHFTEALVRRAESAGYGAIVPTVDSPRWGRKERFARVEDGLPPAPTRPASRKVWARRPSSPPRLRGRMWRGSGL